MSFETTQARYAAAEAESRWKRHRGDCLRCSRKDDRCRFGVPLYDDMIAARAELAENRRLDKAPIPGQGTLL